MDPTRKLVNVYACLPQLRAAFFFTDKLLPMAVPTHVRLPPQGILDAAVVRFTAMPHGKVHRHEQPHRDAHVQHPSSRSKLRARIAPRPGIWYSCVHAADRSGSRRRSVLNMAPPVLGSMKDPPTPDCVCKTNKIKLILVLTHGGRERHLSLLLASFDSSDSDDPLISTIHACDRALIFDLTYFFLHIVIL